MKKKLLFLVILSIYCQFVVAQSQTKTANLFNWNNNPYLNLWAQEGPQYVSADDNLFAYSKKLSSGRSFLSLTLQDFRFGIPSNATIRNINVLARRFKKGTGSIKDYFATLVITGTGFYNPSPYGIRWTIPTNYPGAEAISLYSQNGSGTNGGLNANQSYRWTPAMVNSSAFGVRIDTYAPVGGSVTVYYDQVQITVQYTLPTTSSAVIEPTTLMETTVYPNPFISKTNIQFKAPETGNAVVELYNILGMKLETLFSGKVVQGQVYYVVAGKGILSKGTYYYMIRNGKQNFTGRITKLQ
jgi:hypothetical protein